MILELFSGTGVMSKAFRDAGHQTYSIDTDIKFGADSTEDILTLTKKDLPKEFQNPDVIWASPPCTVFSVMRMGHHWTSHGRPKRSSTHIGIALAMKTFELIAELKPKYWFVENPVGMMRQMHFMSNMLRRTVTYCQYGESYQKPTDIWTNCTHWYPKRPCKPGSSCHIAARRGDKSGVQNLSGASRRGRLPAELCKEIVQTVNQKPGKHQIKDFVEKKNIIERNINHRTNDIGCTHKVQQKKP